MHKSSDVYVCIHLFHPLFPFSKKANFPHITSFPPATSALNSWYHLAAQLQVISVRGTSWSKTSECSVNGATSGFPPLTLSRTPSLPSPLHHQSLSPRLLLSAYEHTDPWTRSGDGEGWGRWGRRGTPVPAQLKIRKSEYNFWLYSQLFTSSDSTNQGWKTVFSIHSWESGWESENAVFHP